jgi:hypothetical protein
MIPGQTDRDNRQGDDTRIADPDPNSGLLTGFPAG